MAMITKNNNELLKRINSYMFPKEYRQDYYFAKNYLTRYRYLLNKKRPDNNIINNPYPNKIWVYWNKGITNAPQAIKKCLESIKRYSNGREVIILDDNNIKKYIKLPDCIQKKYKEGIMKVQHFSDVLRIFLLRDYGGVWLDISTLCVSDIPDYIFEVECLFASKKHIDHSKLRESRYSFYFTNNLISAKNPHNYLIELSAEFFSEYWKIEDEPMSYAFYQIFMGIACEEDPICRSIFQKIPYTDNLWTLHINGWQKKYSQQDWDRYKRLSPLHKMGLSCKVLEQKPVSGSYLEKLLKGELK